MANVAISSYSAVNAIVLLSQATNGNALDQLKSKLNFNGTESDLLDYYVAYKKSLTESAKQSTMTVANKLYVQQGYQINQKFKDLATQKLLSGVEMVNFTNSNETAKTINGFVAEKTKNKTGDIIKPESMNANTRIILLNSIYMKLAFEKVYQSIKIDKKRDNSFFVSGDNTYTIYNDIEYVLFDYGWFKYADLKDLGAQALDIRFANSDFSLLLILPDDIENLSSLEPKIKDLTKIFDQMKPERVKVKIPIFEIKYQINLKNIANKVCVMNECFFTQK